MTKTELLTAIVQKQDELIEWLDSDLESGDALIRLQLSILKKRLEECEDNPGQSNYDCQKPWCDPNIE